MIFRGKLPDTVAAVPGGSSLVWYNHSIWLSGCQAFFYYFDQILLKINFAPSTICCYFQIPNRITIQNQLCVSQRIVVDQPVQF